VVEEGRRGAGFVVFTFTVLRRRLLAIRRFAGFGLGMTFFAETRARESSSSSLDILLRPGISYAFAMA
jgi:hypothetical protein